MLLLIVIAVAAAVAVWWFRYRPRAAIQRTQAAIAQVLPSTFVVVDLETTGLDASKHEVIELAAIRVNRDSNQHDFLQALVRPAGKVPANITQLTGITQDMVDKEGEPLDTVLRQFIEFAADHRIVTFNAEFDMAFLHRASQRIDVKIENPVSCALKMARRAWPGRKSYRLVDLSRSVAEDAGDAHRALGDCKRALTVYCAAAIQLGRVD